MMTCFNLLLLHGLYPHTIHVRTPSPWTIIMVHRPRPVGSFPLSLWPNCSVRWPNPNASIVCCPLSTFPAVVCLPTLCAVIVHHHHLLPLLLSPAAAVFHRRHLCRSHHCHSAVSTISHCLLSSFLIIVCRSISRAIVDCHHLSPLLPSLSAATVFHFCSHYCHSAVSTISCHRRFLPFVVHHPILHAFVNHRCHLCPATLLSASTIIIRRCHIPPLQPSLPLFHLPLGAGTIAVAIVVAIAVTIAVTIAIAIAMLPLPTLSP
jgi:hypothetical protein